MIKLDVPISRQSDDSRCGPATLCSVFRFFGVDATEDELAAAMNHSYEEGTDEAGLRRAAKTYGFTVTIKDDAGFSQIERCLQNGVPPIVDWFFVDNGHYSIATGLNQRFIWLMEPYHGRIRRMFRHDFMRCWFDWKPSKPVITEWDDLILRRMIVVKPTGGK